MKVLLLDLWRTIESKGGTEKVFFSMANALDERGYDVIAVGMDNTVGNPGFPVNKGVNFINVGIGFAEEKSLLFKIRRALSGSREKRRLYDEKVNDALKAARIKPVIETEKPDIIISYNVEATRILINSIKVNTPVITMFHFDPETILNSITAKTKSALEECACVQVLLPSFIDITRKYINNSNIICIPNIVPQYEIIGTEKRKNTIIMVARVDGKQKRNHLLIEAFNLIKGKYPDWKVEFWGEKDYDKQYYKKCTSLIEKYNLGNRIAFCGTTNNVLEKLQRAKICAFPSAYEGFCLAFTEAMAAELPCLGMRYAPSVNEIIINGYNGFLCDDTKELAEKLACLMDDEALRKQMGINARESIKKYAPEIVWKQWEDLISSCVGEKK